jgi:hypothetical protein
MDTAALAQMLPQFDSQMKLGKFDKLQHRMASRGELEIGESQQDVAEGKDPKAMVQEVAKIVKSFYNRDNPEVGPFRGGEGIALDVEKQISEKFGEKAGQQAREMAEQFMEKLTMEWQQRHGNARVSNNDGLARLKELVGNIKGRVEEMGGDTGVPPGNIMPSTEMESILRLINYKK